MFPSLKATNNRTAMFVAVGDGIGLGPGFPGFRLSGCTLGFIGVSPLATGIPSKLR